MSIAKHPPAAYRQFMAIAVPAQPTGPRQSVRPRTRFLAVLEDRLRHPASAIVAG